MHFVQAGFLGALAALAIPVIIHLLFRTRPRPVDLGTLQFLRVVLSANARRRRRSPGRPTSPAAASSRPPAPLITPPRWPGPATSWSGPAGAPRSFTSS